MFNIKFKQYYDICTGLLDFLHIGNKSYDNLTDQKFYKVKIRAIVNGGNAINTARPKRQK